MPNPYLGRTTITDPDDFFGRREEIENIYERIKSKVPQSVAVVGERKMGKSSLLYYIYHERDKYLDNPEKYIFIFIDIQGVTINSRDEFFKLLLSRLRENEKLQDIIVEDRRRDDHENVKETVSKLDGDGYKLILFLDEFDLLLQKGSISPELYENLRALANRYAIAYITATVKSPTELTKEYGSPFFNIFTGENIELFSRDEALELIEVPSAREGVPLKNEADFVFEIAGFYPYFIQIACSILFGYKTKKERLDYKKIREKFLTESRFQFEHIWKYLNKKEKEVLLKLAKSKAVGKRKNYILDDLRRKGYVSKKGKRYEIFSSVFKDFVAERKDKNVKKDEDSKLGYKTIAITIAIISLIIAGFAGAIIALREKFPEFSSDVIAGIVAAGMVLLFGFVIYGYIEIKYTEKINKTYRKYPKKSRELYDGLNKVKMDLEAEVNIPGIFGLLKRRFYEKNYERIKKKIDDRLSETRVGMMTKEENKKD